MRRKAGAFIGAALLAGAAFADAPGPDIDALHFEVSVAPDFKAQTIAGTTALEFTSLHDGLSAFTLTANALTIESATLDGAPVRVAVEGKSFRFTLPRSLAVGEKATLAFDYHGAPKQGVMFDGDSVYTSYFACDWMICAQDSPGDKASLGLHILLPTDMTALGIGEEIGVTNTIGGLRDHHWRSDRPYSQYIFAFAAGRYDRWTDRAGKTELLVLGRGIDPAQLKARFGTTAAMLAFFEEKAGVPFPHPRYTQLYVPQDEAQEAATFSIIGEPDIGPILTDPAEDWAIAHELAHQYWGNLLTCTDWSQFWLNEGITTFMTAAWKEHAFGRAAYDREMDLARKRVQKAKDKGVDEKLTFPGPYPSLGLKRAIVYSKGALFMDALRSELGDDIFWRAFRAYTQAHIGGTVTSKDFQAAFEAEAGRSLQDLFDAWVY